MQGRPVPVVVLSVYLATVSKFCCQPHPTIWCRASRAICGALSSPLLFCPNHSAGKVSKPLYGHGGFGPEYRGSGALPAVSGALPAVMAMAPASSRELSMENRRVNF